jgi:hypothetical protein
MNCVSELQRRERNSLLTHLVASIQHGHPHASTGSAADFIVVFQTLLEWLLITQYVPNRHNQIAAEFVSSFAALVFNPMVTSTIPEWPVFEFSIAVINHFSAYLFTEKIIQRPRLSRVAGKTNDGTIGCY